MHKCIQVLAFVSVYVLFEVMFHAFEFKINRTEKQEEKNPTSASRTQNSV